MNQPEAEQTDIPVSDDIKNLRKKTIKGVIWTLTEMLGNHGISFVVMIYLARLLSPADYGLIGIATAFFAIAWVIIDGGFRVTLIRKKSVSPTDYNTIFYTNLAVSVIVYAVIYFLIAPFTAKFYKEPVLADLIRILGLTFIFGAVSIIQDVDMRRKMNFRSLAFITIPAGAVSGVTAILLAYNGFGVLSLAIKIPLHYLLMMLLYWCLNSWRPKLEFCIKSFKELFGSGFKYTVSSFLYALYYNINPMVIGKIFSAQTLGFYTFTEKIIMLSCHDVLRAVEKVSLSAFSKIQDDAARLLYGYKQLLKNTTALIFPLMVILAVMAEPLFTLFLGVKWLPAIPYLRILCVISVLQPLCLVNMNIIMIKGTPGLFSKINIFSILSLVTLLFILIRFGIEVFLTGHLFHTAVMIFIANFFSSRFVAYPVWAQVRDITPIALSAAVMGAALYFFMTLFENINLLQTGYLLTAAAAVYVFALWIMRVDIVTKLFSAAVSKLQARSLSQ